MDSQRFRVINRARGGFLSLEVAVAATTARSVKELVEDIAGQADTGLWLKPYRGIPMNPGLPPFDLIYLDDDCRVIQEVESFPTASIKLLRSQPAGALILAAQTTFASQIQPGDKLEFCAPEEMECWVERLPDPVGAGPSAQSGESPAGEFSGKDVSTPSRSDDRSGQVQLVIQQLGDKGEAESRGGKNASLGDRFLLWLSADAVDQRRGNRYPLPGLVAYGWTGGAPQAQHIANISNSGLFLLTKERPSPGTMILMTLQREGTSGDEPGDSIAVLTKVVRWGPDGVGLKLIPTRNANRNSGETQAINGVDQKALEEFLKQLNLQED